jgi:hypothetical protein
LIDLERALQELHRGGVEFHVKRAAGRPKDLEAIAELEALREERRDQEEA